MRHTRGKDHLSNLHVRSSEYEDTDTSAAPYKLYNRVLTLSPQVHELHEGDAHKIQYLRAAVVGYDFSDEPLSRITTASLSFQKRYAELNISGDLCNENRAAMEHEKTDLREATFTSINFTRQGRYFRPNSSHFP